MRRTIILFAIIFSWQILFSQEEKADAVYLKVLKEYRLNPDGSWDYHYEKQQKLLTYFSFHRLYGETFIVYNPDFQKLEFDHAYTIMADGKKIETPDNAFNEVLPRAAANAPAYNQLREMVVTHTGLERNAVVHLGYTLKNAKDFYPAFMGKELIGDYSPIKELTIRVVVPAGTELNHKTYGIRTAPEITNTKSGTVYTWKFVNLKGISHDPNKPGNWQPGIIFSAARDLHRTYDKFVNQKGFMFQANRDMTNKAKSVWEETKDEIKTMISLQNMVQTEISSYGVSLQDAGFRVRPPVATWESNGGTALEKTLLLTTLLRQANINANAMAVISDKYYDRGMGNLLVIEDYLVQVNPKKHGQFYISAYRNNAQNLRFNLAGKQLLILDAAIESLRTFEEKQQKNLVRFGCGIVIESAERMLGTYEVELEYFDNPYLKIYKDSSAVEGLVKGFGKKEIKSSDLLRLGENKSVARFSFEKDNPFKEKAGYYFYQIPEPSNALPGWQFSKLPSVRREPLDIGQAVKLEYNYSFSIPDNLELVNRDEYIHMENNAGKMTIKIEKVKDELLIIRSLELPHKVIPVKDYKDFRLLMTNWYDKNYKELIFKSE